MNSSTGPAVPRRARPVISHPRYGESPGRSRGRTIGILAGLFLFLLLLSLAVAGALYWGIHQSRGGSSRTVMFHVGNGDTVGTIGDRLSREGLIGNPWLFKLDARVRGLASKLEVGDYPLRKNMSVDETVSALSTYHAKTVPVTIPEGFRMEQTAQALDARGIDGAAFLREARHPSDLSASILASLPRGKSLEGYLYPNTYDVPLHFSGRAFARDMVATLDRVFTQKMRARARAEHLTVYQVLTLASIVEREAHVPQERPIIASVYLNRLNRKMGSQVNWRLQADPTVQYVVGTPARWWPLLTVDQLRANSPYNTYLHRGLPPGPIASPGLSSIRAVLYPAHTRYLYFLAKGHGRHAFAETYQQQLANQQKYSTATP